MAADQKTASGRARVFTVNMAISLIGALGGYVAVLAVLIRPLGVVVLWLQLVRTGLLSDPVTAWYAAWKASTDVVVQNILFVFFWSFVPVFSIFGVMGAYGARNDYITNFRPRRASKRRALGYPEEDEETQRKKMIQHQRLIAFVAAFWLLAFAAGSAYILGFTWLRFGRISLYLAVCSLLVGWLAYVLGRPIFGPMLYERRPITWRQRLGVVAIVYVGAIVVAVYLSGQQSPRLPSVKYERLDAEKEKNATLLSYSEYYWSFIDCEGDLLVISAHEIESAQITGKPSLCSTSHGGLSF
jgi:hypothetical protein